MTLYRVTRVVSKTILIVGLTAAYLTVFAAIAGFTTPTAVTFVALTAGALMFLSALAFFAASRSVWKRSAISDEREHAA